MFNLSQDEINQLKGETLIISIADDFISIKLNKIIAVSNYKKLARMGKIFNKQINEAIFPIIKNFTRRSVLETNKEFSIYYCPADEMGYGIKEDKWDESIKWYYGDKSEIFNFCLKMNKGKIKQFNSLKDVKSKKKAKSFNRPSRNMDIKNKDKEPSWMDIPVWDKERSEWYDAEY